MEADIKQLKKSALAKVIVIGASPDAGKYSNMAVKRLIEKGYTVVPIGKQTGEIEHIKIISPDEDPGNADTITVYLHPRNQTSLYSLIKKTNPRRIIFNPGAENQSLKEKLTTEGYNVSEACTLVLLSTGQF